jgi:hypothetical protein
MVNLVSESDLQQFIQMEAVKYRSNLMRNNSGALKDKDGRWIFYGLGNVSKKHGDKIKSSDLIGVTMRTMGPEDIGKTYALFTAIEVKEPGWTYKGTPREVAQKAFIDWVQSFGGLAGFAQSIDDMKRILGF